MSIQSEINRISGNVANALTAIANKGVTVPQGSNSDDLPTLIAQISGGGTEAISIVDTPDAAGGTVRTITALDISDSTLTTADQLAQGVTAYNKLGVKLTGTGGGGPRQEITGTFTGNGGITQQISCSFAPDVIYVHCDLSVDPSLRGLVSFTIIKDTEICLTADMSSSSYSETPLGIARGITGYNESEPTTPHATYSNGVLTLDTANNTTSNRFVSGITYSYELIAYGSSGATQHTIHLEFSDNTDADIEVDYDDALVGTMITSYAPSPWTYNNKMVVEAQLDGVTWYEYSPIPIGVELVDYTTCVSDTAIGSDGSTMVQEWYYTSDYTAIDPSMSFSYRAGTWFYIGFYTEAKTTISTLYAYTDGTQDPSDSNTAYGTLTGKIPSNAAYVRLCGTWYDAAHMSLIRTA